MEPGDILSVGRSAPGFIRAALLQRDGVFTISLVVRVPPANFFDSHVFRRKGMVVLLLVRCGIPYYMTRARRAPALRIFDKR